MSGVRQAGTHAMSALRKLLERGAAALAPQKVNGVWRKPEVTALQAARLRALFQREGRRARARAPLPQSRSRGGRRRVMRPERFVVSPARARARQRVGVRRRLAASWGRRA